MPLTVPFKDTDRRNAWLRVVLLAATFFGLLTSWPLWLNTRDYPLVPVSATFPIFLSPLDKLFFAAMLAALVAAFRFYRPAIITFLVLSFIAFCEDQNRGQPWFYMYWVLLVLTLFPGSVAIAAARCAISAIYIWSGLQKCNARFFQIEPNWFVAPAAHWHLPEFALALLRLTVSCTPFLEIGIGVALWSKKFRTAGIIGVLLIHIGALLFLGPIGYNYNWVVMPWNFAMIGLVWVLFARAKAIVGIPETSSNTGFRNSLAELRRAPIAFAIIAAFSILPLLSFAGYWDSYFSFSLYSENTATANIFVTKAFVDRLPVKLQGDVQLFPQAFDPQFQGPYVFSAAAWCYQELHVPPLPEPRGFRSAFQYLRRYSHDSHDLRMIVGQRGGSVIFYEGDYHRSLQAK